ncbi:MAG: glycosyltransferase 87 family protein [Chlamydiota bacterium]
MRRMLKCLLWLFVICYLTRLFYQVASDTGEYQWDFRHAYYASQAYLAGMNPYSAEVLTRLAGQYTGMRIVYPPHSLLYFAFFTLFTWHTAFYLFLGLKGAALIALGWLWKKFMPGERAGAGFYCFCLLAYFNPLSIDVWVGNRTVFEQLVLWGAFLCFLRGRLIWFCSLVVILASWRASEVLFLSLLLVSPSPRKYRYLWGSCGALALVLLLSYAAQPVLYGNSMRNLALECADKMQQSCPVSRCFIKDALMMVSLKIGIPLPSSIVTVSYWGWVILVIGITVRACRRLYVSRSDEAAKVMIFLVCFAYILIFPYGSGYWYALLLVPTYYVITCMVSGRAFPFLFIILAMNRDGNFFNLSLYNLMWTYYPLLCAVLVWGLCLRTVFEREDAGASRCMT